MTKAMDLSKGVGEEEILDIIHKKYPKIKNTAKSEKEYETRLMESF